MIVPAETVPAVVPSVLSIYEPEIVTMHEKMFRMARAKYNPFAVGGSEDLGGGSEIFHEKA